MSIHPISSAGAPAASGGYSQGISAGGFLFLSGQGPFAPDGSLANAVRVGVYLSDLAHFDEMDRVYRELFAEPRPARTTIQTDLVGFDVEADAVVLLDG